MTGAELRAWRERLGKDEAWAAQICAELSFAFYRGWPRESKAGRERRDAAEGDAHWDYSQSEADALRTAYAAALEAEEARQAAERGPVEPVCPEGVKSWPGYGQFSAETYIGMDGTGFGLVSVGAAGEVAITHQAGACSPTLLEYAAALSRYRATLHAASDRQRKLDAVRAAEEAHDAAHKATEDAYAAYREAEAAVGRTHSALKAARREAGL